MRVLRGTLTFVLGMIIGIVLFVVAIGGTLAILATQMTIGQLQQAVVGSDSVISSDSDIYDKTILDAVKDVVSDVQNFDKLSLKTLYEHYGIKLLNGISGIDFTNKDFYSVPIADLVNDLSIVVNSFTLNDVSKIAGVDFASYGLPILTNNLDNNLSTAVDNILGSLNGDLSIRAINTNFGIDLGANDNELLSTLQDVVLSEFGNVMNVLRVSAILEADTDTFIPANPADRKYFERVSLYEEIPASELPSTSCKLGVETSLIGGLDTDGDGTADKMKIVETRYVKTISNIEGNQVTSFDVDNSSYSENFDFENNNKTFYRHYSFLPSENTSGDGIYILCYANRVEDINGNDYTLVEKGFVPADELEFNSDFWAMTGDVLDKDSKLGQLEEDQIFDGKTFERVHVGSSTKLLQSIAHMTVSELQAADNLLEGLTISDVIDITPDTARIIKSLAARNCKILELGTVANDLSLGEMIDIVTYRYEKSGSGKYVRIEDKNSFTIFDKTNPDMIGLQRYKKTANGYEPDDNGKFVHSVYYTLYNPADPKQADCDRYNRVPGADGETVSSALLQRFAGATLGGFSDAFDSLMLADVLQIDADIYEQINIDDINEKSTERYFRYDAELGVYRVVSIDEIKENPTVKYYRISYSGETTTFMKKLAYVKIDDMATAMDAVIDDMMFSEFVYVFTEDAVELFEHTDKVSEENPLSADKKYFIEYGVDGNAYESVTLDENNKEVKTKYVYVYDSFGDYTKSNFRAVDVTDYISDSNTYYYHYLKYSTLPFDTELDIASSLSKANQGNMYYFDKKDELYKQNYALCLYLLLHGYRDQVYFRNICSASDEGAILAHNKYYNGTTVPAYGLYAKFDSLGYFQYSDNNPIFADKDLFTFEKSSTDRFEDMFFIDKSEVPYLDAVLNSSGFKTNGYYFARRKCIDVYVLTENSTNSTFVYIDGQYVPYDSEKHTGMPRFECRQGYIGEINEVSTQNGTATELTIQDVKFIRERSAAVLRTLARGTIGEMTSIITNATVGDIIEAEPGTMFDKETIKDAKITELGTVFKDILTKMTIGELMTWSNVSGVDDDVKNALDGVTINALFSSLVFDKTTGEIKVDIPRIYGYDVKNNTTV